MVVAEIEETEAADVTAGSILVLEQRKKGQQVGLPLITRFGPSLKTDGATARGRRAW